MNKLALGDIAEIFQGPTSKRIAGRGNRLFTIKGGDLHAFELKASFLQDEIETNVNLLRSHLIVREKDILTSIRGSIFNTSIFISKGSKGSIPSSNIALIRISDEEKVMPEYLTAILGSSYGKRLAERYTHSTGISMISLSSLRELAIPIPALEVQQQISTMFKAISDFNIASKKIKDIETKLAETRLSEIFGDEP